MVGESMKQYSSVDQAFAAALEYHQNGNLYEAQTIYHHILQIEPTHYQSIGNLGLLSIQLDKIYQAREYLIRATTVNPDYQEAYTNLGNLYFQQSEFELAINAYQNAVRISPDDEEVWANLGNAFLKEKRDKEAVKSYKKALKLNPNRPDLYDFLGDCYYILEQYKTAIVSYRNVLKIDKTNATCYYKLGQAYQQIGQYRHSIDCYKRSLSLQPENAEVNCQLGTVLLLTGDYKNGWLKYEWRRKINKYKRNIVQPAWVGGDCRGKTLLVYAEQGLGDTIQFSRFIPFLEDKDCLVVFECQPPLKPFFEEWNPFSGFVDVFSTGEDLPEFDLYVPLMSLPYILNLDMIEKIPHPLRGRPFSSVPNQKMNNRLSNENNLQVGLVWAGNPEHARDSHRSMKFNQILDWLNTPGCDFFSLQVGVAARELYETTNLPISSSIVDLGKTFNNFFDTAKAISQLDLVISVDTSVAHLAATMEIPTWIMLTANPDWRWLLSQTKSPWYPSVRLFRQVWGGGWDSVILKIGGEIKKLAMLKKN